MMPQPVGFFGPLYRAVKAFLAKHEECMPIMATQGLLYERMLGPYQGPTYTKELRKLQEVIAVIEEFKQEQPKEG